MSTRPESKFTGYYDSNNDPIYDDSILSFTIPRIYATPEWNGKDWSVGDGWRLWMFYQDNGAPGVKPPTIVGKGDMEKFLRGITKNPKL